MHTEAPRLLGVVLLSCASLALADKRPLDLADFHRLQDVSEPAFAPHGDAIVYTLTSNNLDSDAQVSDLWRVSWRGGEPLQLTHTPFASEWHPQWRSDG